MKLVYIRWRDALSEEAAEPHRAVTPGLAELHEVGFLLGESDEAVTIGMEIAADDSMEPGRWRLHIPRAQIQEMRVVDLSAFLKMRAARKKRG